MEIIPRSYKYLPVTKIEPANAGFLVKVTNYLAIWSSEYLEDWLFVAFHNYKRYRKQAQIKEVLGILYI